MTTYIPQSGDMLAPGSVTSTELLSRVGGFIAGCGQAALAVILGAVNGISVSPDTVTMMIQQSVNQHLTVGPKAASGQITPSGLKTLAQEQGVTLTDVAPQNALAQYAGSKDIIIGLNDAWALGGNDANPKVYGHYITVVGKTAQGNLIVNDPNSTESTTGQYVVYTPQQIQNANPFWAGVAEQPQLTSTTGTNNNPLDLVGAVMNVGAQVKTVGDILGTLKTGLTTIWSKLQPWMNFPDIAKLVAGSLLISIAVQTTIAQHAAPDILTAAGYPDVGNAVRSFMGNTGRQSAIKGGEARTTRMTREAKATGEKTGYQQRETERHEAASAASKRGHQTRREREQREREEAERQAKTQTPPASSPRKPQRVGGIYYSRVRPMRATRTGAEGRAMREAQKGGNSGGDLGRAE